jgi:predicted nucleotidyltransferase
VRPLLEYVTLDEPRRKVESFSLEEGNLDLQLWDIRKARATDDALLTWLAD